MAHVYKDLSTTRSCVFGSSIYYTIYIVYRCCIALNNCSELLSAVIRQSAIAFWHGRTYKSENTYSKTGSVCVRADIPILKFCSTCNLSRVCQEVYITVQPHWGECALFTVYKMVYYQRLTIPSKSWLTNKKWHRYMLNRTAVLEAQKRQYSENPSEKRQHHKLGMLQELLV